MRDKTALWRLYNLATAYGKRPSEFVEFETELANWALDEACLMVGRTYESALQNGKDPFKDAGPKAQVKGKYAPAPKRKIKKVKSLAEIGIRDGNTTR